MNPHLAGIRIFPIKSLDPETLEEARVHGGAGLEHDREYQLVDEQGRTLNGKRAGEKLMRIRSHFSFIFGEATLEDGESSIAARLPSKAAKLEAWLGERLAQTVKIERDAERGFPDDVEASGPTVISRATLVEVGGWFELGEDEARRRFRANLEIDGVPAFWEDRLYRPDASRRFTIGEVAFEGVNPCKRCAVPSHDSRTGGIPEPRFARLFAERRRETLPEWAPRERFDTFYRLSVNTRIPPSENGKALSLGDEVWIEE